MEIYRPRRNLRTASLEIRGIDYAVHEWGERGARLLLCLHGWGDTGRSFQFLADALADDWHVVAPDWRGFGDTGRNRGPYWFPDYLADLHALVERYAPASPADILGHSMGGNVAGLYAGIFPERVRAFVNVEGFGLLDADPDAAPGRYRDWIERASAGEAFSTYPDYESLAAKIRSRSPRMSLPAARFVACAWGREIRGKVELKADPAHRLPNAVLYRRAEAEACWRRVTAPVLLLGGGASAFRDRLHAHDGPFDFALPFPLVSELTIEAAGHMLHFEAPRDLAQACEDFLGDSV